MFVRLPQNFMNFLSWGKIGKRTHSRLTIDSDDNSSVSSNRLRGQQWARSVYSSIGWRKVVFSVPATCSAGAHRMLLRGCCEGNLSLHYPLLGVEEGTGTAVEVHSTLHQAGARHRKEAGTKEEGTGDAATSWCLLLLRRRRRRPSWLQCNSILKLHLRSSRRRITYLAMMVLLDYRSLGSCCWCCAMM